MEYCCYILYSRLLDKYYIGETEDIEKRLILHNTGFFKPSFTSKTSDWVLYLKIECNNRKIARYIERHIKSMKSRKYIENLKKYPEMIMKIQKEFHK